MRVTVTGAGLAGLTCAKMLKVRGAEIAVFKASDGGRVLTDEKLSRSCRATPRLYGQKAAGEVLR